jgi:hypothetical protein
MMVFHFLSKKDSADDASGSISDGGSVAQRSNDKTLGQNLIGFI